MASNVGWSQHYQAVENILAAIAVILTWVGSYRSLCDFIKSTKTSLQFGIWQYLDSSESSTCNDYPDNVQIDANWMAARAFSVLSLIFTVIVIAAIIFFARASDPDKLSNSLAHHGKMQQSKVQIETQNTPSERNEQSKEVGEVQKSRRTERGLGSVLMGRLSSVRALSGGKGPCDICGEAHPTLRCRYLLTDEEDIPQDVRDRMQRLKQEKEAQKMNSQRSQLHGLVSANEKKANSLTPIVETQPYHDNVSTNAQPNVSRIRSWMAPFYLLTALCQGLVLLLLNSNACKANIQVEEKLGHMSDCSMSQGAKLITSATAFWFAASLASFAAHKYEKKRVVEGQDASLIQPLVPPA